ncbi:hypothetical protein JB92DRAFT_808557 [Gautieria morchelliformis]|nr:hypothetical protein JB92DRAFT_808557 [Gautieria morchelliformis]
MLMRTMRTMNRLAATIFVVMKFAIPSHNQLGIVANRTHTVELESTLGAVKSTLHYILGLYAIPEERRTGLVTHFYKDPAKCCFALETKEEWTALKAQWVNQVAKRGTDACIDIVLPPKFFEFLEEAVKVQTGTTGKPKKKKELVNPFLSQKEPVTSEIPDKRALNGTKTAEYEAQLQKLLDFWTCDQHAGEICMACTLNRQHKVINLQGELVWVLQLMAGKPGVDLNTLPNVEYFKFFHSMPGGANPAASNYVRRSGARYVSNKPMQQATPVS